MNLNFKSQRTGKQLPKVHLSNIKASINSTSAKLLLANTMYNLNPGLLQNISFIYSDESGATKLLFKSSYRI